MGYSVASCFTDDFIIFTEMDDSANFPSGRLTPETEDSLSSFVEEHLLLELVVFIAEILHSAHLTVIVIILSSHPVAVFIEVVYEIKSIIIPKSDIFFIYPIVIKSISIVVFSLGYGIAFFIIGKVYFQFTDINLIFISI